MDSILLFSAGKESLYQLHHKQKVIGKLIMFDYGQLSFPAEFTSLRYYAKLYDKPYQVIKLDFFILPPAIKDGIDCNPYVAQRNLVFCSIALSLAEVGGYKKVFLGAVADAVDFDGSPRFVDDMNYLLASSSVKVESFSRRYTTGQILASLVKNKVDISHLWSCDNPRDAPTFCGSCAKCTSALRNLRDHYSNNKLVRKFYDQKYKNSDILNVLSYEFGQEQKICER